MASHVKFRNRIDKVFYKLDRESLLKEQGGVCYYCKCTLTRKTATLDHVIPLVKTQRRHSKTNCVVSCEPCNTKKGSKIIQEVKKDWWDQALIDMEHRLRERTKLAEWRLDFNSKGSFKKWKTYWEKRGRWIK